MKSKSISPKKPNNNLLGAGIFFIIYVIVQFVFSSFDIIDIVAAFVGALIFYFIMVYFGKKK